MIKPIIKDICFLKQKSTPATPLDIQVAYDLQDTLKAHQNECVGMAANMIGSLKRIIIINMGIINLVMINPQLTHKSQPYQTTESCLSLNGERSTTRYKHIEVTYQDLQFNTHTIQLDDWYAQICQHELDHLEGIII